MAGATAGAFIGGKYRLERPLAHGGMGSVWVAWQAGLERWVALKFMAPELTSSPLAWARFDREAKAAAQLRTPHVVQIHDHGIEGDAPYIVMELLEGEDLDRRLKRVGRLPLAAVARILAQAAKALRRAHEAGIVHRDLKPANVFLARSDDEEVVKVLDFGIARSSGAVESTGPDATKTGSVIGSPLYMSPEQARGMKTMDHRSDLWSLGVIAFRALTGQVPFPGDEIGDIIIRVWNDPVPRPSSLAPDLGPEVDRYFAKALAKDPNERFQSATEMAAAFAAMANVGYVAINASGEYPASPAILGAPAPYPPAPVPAVTGPYVAHAPPPVIERPSGTLTNIGNSVDLTARRAPGGASSTAPWVIAIVSLGALLATIVVAIVLVRGGSGAAPPASVATTSAHPAAASGSAAAADAPATPAASSDPSAGASASTPAASATAPATKGSGGLPTGKRRHDFGY